MLISPDLLQAIYREAVFFAAVGFFVIGIDEIAVDLVWLSLGLRRLIGREAADVPVSLDQLPTPKEPLRFAVCIPARDESAVIGAMLGHALRAYAGRNVHIFVGCYSSDPATIEVVRRYCGPDLSLVLFEKEGSSTKAECLNRIILDLADHERRSGQQFAGIVLHDAEDAVDGREIAVFEAFADRHAMIQLPVIPAIDRKSRWVSGHYCDEFAEAHAKTLIVRQALGAALPSAGVGCMIRRDALMSLAKAGGGKPFAEDSITEDYELGLKIAALGYKSAFLRIRQPGGRNVIATHACFPATFPRAVRQKTRWVSGIALGGWDRVGWGHGLAENWMRLRDRMSLLAALIAAVGYIVAIPGIPLLAIGYFRGAPLVRFDAFLVGLVQANGLIMIWRLYMRLGFTASVYGWREGCRALPRIAVSGVMSIFVSGCAIPHYHRQFRTGIVTWDKTEHEFPEMVAPS